MALSREATSIELASTFAEMARALLPEGDVAATVKRICDMAVTTLDACEHAGASVVKHRKIKPAGGTDEIPALVDAIQSDVDEGPCLDAIRHHEVFQTGRLSQETRWPHFSKRAHEESGIESILSFRLFTQTDTYGALNLYSTRVDAFDGDDVAVATIFAAHAAVAMAGATRQEQLEEAVQTRDLIGRAKGILIAREHVSDDEAFEMLRRASQRLNLKLREVARKVAVGEPPSDVNHKQPTL